jgi:tape measure domain-containing protein
VSKDISIVFKSQDQLSQSILQMKQKVKEFGKDIEDYRKIQDKAFGEKAKLQLDARKAKEELKELNKLIKQGKEGSEEAFIKKQKEINQMSEGMKRYNKIIKDASKAERDLHTTRSRNANDPNNYNSNNHGIAKQLVQAGMLKELGNSMGNYMGASLTSKYGDKLGNEIGGAISSTLSGALMGGLVGGPIGAAIGGAIGLGTGIINAFTEEKKDKDNYFKDEVKAIYSRVAELTNADLQNGIQLAKQRENDVIAFKTILGGKYSANHFINDTEKFASRTPFQQSELLSLSKSMMTYGYNQNEVIPNLTKLGDAFSALGIDSGGKKASIVALGRMKSSGKTTLDNINILQDKGIDAVGILAEKMETTKAKVYEMISKGAINGEDTARTIIDAVGEKYKGAMEEFSQTTSGLESTLADLKARGDRAEGTGFNEERKKGIQAEIRYLEQLKTEDKKYIGQYKAGLKNKEEELMRSTIESAKKSEEYRKAVAKGNGAEIGRILAEAQTKAIIEWNNSPEMQKIHENELARLKATQRYIANSGEYVLFGRKMHEQFNKGWDSVKTTNATDTNKTKHNNYERYYSIAYSYGYNKHASGINRVPTDNYPALLHEDEQVLTADEAKQLKNKNDSIKVENINIHINSNNRDDKELANCIVSEINNAIEKIA